MTTPPPSVSDFRKNADRQAREQRAVGSLLSWVAYALVAGLIFIAAAAGFGGYVLWRMVQEQSVTVAQLESRYNTEINSMQQTVQALQERVDQAGTLASHNHEQITSLSTKVENLDGIVRSTRQQVDRDLTLLKNRDLGDLRNRLHHLESHP